MLRVQAFGGFALRLRGELVPDGWIQRRQQALLVVLAAAGERGVSRDRLLLLLWPDSSDEHGRHSLKQSLYLLRRAVGDADAILGRGVLRLNPDVVTSDVGDFDAALARSDPGRAISLYAGSLLDGVYLANTPEWEQWLDQARERYQRLYLEALDARGAQLEEEGALEEAARCWRARAEADPWNARAAVRLVAALERAGDRAAALRAADEYTARVRDGLGTEPDPEVASLAARIRLRPAPHGPPPRTDLANPIGLPAPEQPVEVEPTFAGGVADATWLPDIVAPARGRRLTKGRIAFGILFAGLVFGALPFLGGGRANPNALSVDDAVVAVLPFRVDSSDPTLAYLREGLMDLLSALLVSDESSRAVDSRSVMAAIHAAGAPSPGELSRETALRVAGRVGAGRMLLGQVVGVPGRPGSAPRLIVTASIVEVRDGRARAQARVEGPADSLAMLVDRLAGELLFRESGDQEERAGAALTTSLPALRAYLAGQAADRRFDGEAVNHFLRAIQLDSTFALAGLRLHMALSWATDRTFPEGIGERGLWIAWTHRDRLAKRDRAILFARTGPSFPQLAGIPALLREQERAVRDFPEEPELWIELSETYYHSGSLLGMTDWRERFKAAAENALRLDFEHARREALPHLIAVYAREGDTAQANRLRRLRGSDAASEYLGKSDGRRRPTTDPARAAALKEDLERLPIPRVRQILTSRVVDGVALQEADAAADAMARRAATTSERFAALEARAFLELARGRPAAALRARRALLEGAPDEAARRRLLTNIIYDGLYQDGSRDAAEEASDELERLLARAPPEADSSRDSQGVRSLQQCALEQWRLANGDTRGARSRLAHFRTPDPPAPPFSPGLVIPFRKRACLALLEAWLAHLEKRPDAPALLLRADSSLRTEIPLWLIGYPELYGGNIAVARLFAARGDLPHALAAIRRHSYGTNAPVFLPMFARDQARLAASAGERAEAISAYRYYLAVRSDPEPPLRGDVEKARGELAALLATSSPPMNR